MTKPSIAGAEAFAEIVQAIGSGNAAALASTFGGTSVYVPRCIPSNHDLCRALGPEIAALLAHFYGGTRLNVPKRPACRARVRQLKRQGALTIAAIARETGYSERQVYRILSEADDDNSAACAMEDRQLPLF
ncbi:MAG: hypothetical protein ACOY7T_10150 [Pseudomonadota bacterium]